MKEDHRSIQTQLLDIRNESLTFKIQVPSWPVSSTGRALCTGIAEVKSLNPIQA